MRIDLSNYRNYSLCYDSDAEIDCLSASELNTYVQKVCGFSFVENKTSEKYISIGCNEQSKEIIKNFDNEKLGTDGFRIVFENGNIYIFGNTKQATYFGVCEFIERFLGVRWLNIDTTHIPSKSSIDVEEKDIECKPYFPQRIFYTSQSLALHPENTEKDSATIAAHQKFRFPDTHLEKYLGLPHLWNTRFPSPHNSVYFVPKEKYYSSNPEFYIKSPMGTIDLCYSNGITDDFKLDEGMECSVVKVAANTLYELIKEKPEVEFYSFGKEDDRTAICDCEVCTRRREKLGGESGLMTVFFNVLIEQVEKKLKENELDVDFKIVTLAYQNTENPPIQDGKPVCKEVIPSNRLHIRYAPISANYTYSLTDLRQDALIRGQLLGWASLTSNIMIWDYQNNYTEYCWYFPNLKYFKENLQAYADIGVTYVFNQAAYNINRHWQDELRSYIASKLYWDLTLDVKELQDEYISLCYGVAAEEVKIFIDKMESFFEKKIENGFQVELFVGDKEFFAAKEYPFEFLQDCLSILEKGLEKIKNYPYPAEEKVKREKALTRVLLTPLRMIAKNVSHYFPNQETDYERRVFECVKFVGLTKMGEGVPLFVDVVKDGVCDYKIVVGQEYTEREMQVASVLQKEIEKLCGIRLEIVKDDKVHPSYTERAFCIGNGMMFREFYKGTIRIEDYEYFIDVRGRCAFIFGEGDLIKAVGLFIKQLLIDGKDIILPAIKKEKKLER